MAPICEIILQSLISRLIGWYVGVGVSTFATKKEGDELGYRDMGLGKVQFQSSSCFDLKVINIVQSILLAFFFNRNH